VTQPPALEREACGRRSGHCCLTKTAKRPSVTITTPRRSNHLWAVEQSIARSTTSARKESSWRNIPVSYIGPEPKIVDILLELGVRFVTTSTGRVDPFTARLKDAGVTVFHVVTSLETAKQAADAGVDGLIGGWPHGHLSVPSGPGRGGAPPFQLRREAEGTE
jgi:hypothetical protein